MHLISILQFLFLIPLYNYCTNIINQKHCDNNLFICKMPQNVQKYVEHNSIIFEYVIRVFIFISSGKNRQNRLGRNSKRRQRMQTNFTTVPTKIIQLCRQLMMWAMCAMISENRSTILSIRSERTEVNMREIIFLLVTCCELYQLPQMP